MHDRAASEDDGELVVAGGQAAPLLEFLVGPFDDVAVLVPLGVVADGPAACGAAAQPVALLVGAALLAPLMAALWFAPALVYFHNEPPLTALKVSFFACLKNWLPFLVYGVLLLILLLIAAIPLGLGLLVAGPMTLISGYTSYRDLFTDPA